MCFTALRRHLPFVNNFWKFLPICRFQAVLIALVAVATGAPQYGYPTPAPPTPAPTPGYTYQEPEQTYLAPGTRAEDGAEDSAEEPEAPVEVVPIVKDERVTNEDGSYTVDVETGNGIIASEAGSLNSEGAIVKSGHYSYIAPDGSVIEVKFVADENGFQAESDALPVAPEFPHEIPEFVLRQIEFAAEEDARAAAEAEAALKAAEAPSNLYEHEEQRIPICHTSLNQKLPHTGPKGMKTITSTPLRLLGCLALHRILETPETPESDKKLRNNRAQSLCNTFKKTLNMTFYFCLEISQVPPACIEGSEGGSSLTEGRQRAFPEYISSLGFQPGQQSRQKVGFKVLFAAVASVAVAIPQYPTPAPDPSPSYGVPSSRGVGEVREVVPILRDDRVHEDDGRYSVDVETANGIIASESGSPDGPEGAVVKAGQYAYTAPDGSLIEVKFTADENGFQAEGNHLPVAPEFPHPIPQFVLDQIAFAAEEDALAAAETRDSSPSQLYQRPQ
ncbi:uncharacterized protein LOC125025484 [Penaeus chinensis]|uniref:uncharacterized protein LOC125025484 n=1 Tax=Penaeus chinensis TaxID=139456 RepID=UPI001FB83F17|nr:uncharacterized protein LOC125025484 [Penaeus chinensis]